MASSRPRRSLGAGKPKTVAAYRPLQAAGLVTAGYWLTAAGRERLTALENAA